MQSKTIKVDLNQAGIDRLKTALDDYVNDLKPKCRLFIERLANAGIQVATATGSKGVAFRKSVSNQGTYGCRALVIGSDIYKITSQWLVIDGSGNKTIKSAEVSPLLMAEFGSGFNAENPLGVAGYGQGTFPDQTHAFDVGGWYYMDLDGNWHHSSGVTPKQPMYLAYQEMYRQINAIAKGVFG